jgi:hypothetical protein
MAGASAATTSEGGDVNNRKAIAIALGLIFMLSVSVLAFAEAKTPDTVVLPAPNGGVKFQHKAHSADRGIKCEVCHHTSKPEKAATAPQQKCSDCHTKTAAAPMKTKLQAAFHNPAAQSGVCIDCHKKEVAAGKKAPTKCAECHTEKK